MDAMREKAGEILEAEDDVIWSRSTGNACLEFKIEKMANPKYAGLPGIVSFCKLMLFNEDFS